MAYVIVLASEERIERGGWTYCSHVVSWYLFCLVYQSTIDIALWLIPSHLLQNSTSRKLTNVLYAVTEIDTELPDLTWRGKKKQ
jgi:hypothetical protein